MKKLLKLALCIMLMLVSIYFIHDYYKDSAIKNRYQNIENISSSSEFVADLKNDHKNNEIVMYLEIPNILGIAIPQTDNNEYYLNHNIDKKDSEEGTPFLDYRNRSINDKKLIIYGHSDIYKKLPFANLTNYEEKDFFKDHELIYAYTESGKRTYKIFTVFAEKEDFEYVNIDGYSDVSFYEHISKLKDKSIYDTGTKVDGDSKVLLLQTTKFDDNYNGKTKYLIIGAIEQR